MIEIFKMRSREVARAQRPELLESSIMSDEQSGGNLWKGVFAVVAIAVVGFFIHWQTQPSAPRVPEISVSREELMRAAMVDGLPAAETAKPDPKEPKIANLKKSVSAP
jgi:hypothetical protein